jgi:pyruvate/2-oxoglutarate/acetoin dehydrogenase E1 component
MPELYFSHAIRQALEEEMTRDERVILIGEDLAEYGGAFKVTEGIVGRFGPERVINTPISENSVVGVCVGAAMTGLRPVTEMMFMDFITLAMDQIVNHAAKFRAIYGEQCRVPIVIRCPCGAGRGYGPTHSQSLEPWFVHTPGLKVVAPSTPSDAKGLLKSAIRDDDPVIFLESKALYGLRGDVPEGEYTVPIGHARLAREGSDLSLIAYGRLVCDAVRAHDELAKEGVSAEVLDLRTLKPLDMEAIVRSVSKTGRVVIAEESHRMCGIGAEIGFRLLEECFDVLDAPPRRVAFDDIPIPAAESLERAAMPDWTKILAEARYVLNYGR